MIFACKWIGCPKRSFFGRPGCERCQPQEQSSYTPRRVSDDDDSMSPSLIGNGGLWVEPAPTPEPFTGGGGSFDGGGASSSWSSDSSSSSSSSSDYSSSSSDSGSSSSDSGGSSSTD
jgi:hypothetical protein